MIASPMKALPGLTLRTTTALNDINAPNGKSVAGTDGLHYFDSEDEDDYDKDNLNEASRPSAGPIARRTRARFNMDDVSLDELNNG